MTGIVIDTSAIIAILRGEPEKLRFVETIVAASSCLVSAVSFQEAAVVFAGRLGNENAWTELDTLLEDLGIEVVAHDAALAFLARDAFLRFGKGRHPARLNFGDCATYALARAHDLPLLFNGDDFSQTDIVAAFT